MDLKQEYARQREHLERNLTTLEKKVIKEREQHHSRYIRIMQVMAGTLQLPGENWQWFVVVWLPYVQGGKAFSCFFCSDFLELF